MIEMAALPGYYTIQEAAPILEVSEAQVTRYCQEGKLSAIFVRKQWFIEQGVVHTFEKPRRGNPNWVKTSDAREKNSKK